MKSKTARIPVRFQLKTMIVLVTVLAVIFGLFAQELSREQRKKRNAAEIIRLGGNVRYSLRPENEQTGIINGYLRIFLGDKYFPEVDSVALTTQEQEDIDLVRSFPEMNRLLLSGPSVTDESLARLHSLPKLKYLTLANAVLGDAGLESIANWADLTSLGFADCSLAGQSLNAVVDFPNLLSLDFMNCSMSDEAMKSLTKSTTRTLTFKECTFTDSNLDSLSGAQTTLEARFLVTNVTEAQMLALRAANPGWTVVFDGRSMIQAKSKDYKGTLPSVQELPQIEKLEFLGSLTSDATLAALKNASNLTNLQLKNCSVTDGGLRHLLPLQKLQSLQISGAPITDEGLSTLQQLPNLEILSLRDTAIEGNTLGQLPPSLTRLSLSILKVSEQTVVEIASLPSMRELCFMNSQLSDEAIDGLGKMTKLDILQLLETPISQMDLLRLQMALPDCAIFTK